MTKREETLNEIPLKADEALKLLASGHKYESDEVQKISKEIEALRSNLKKTCEGCKHEDKNKHYDLSIS